MPSFAGGAALPVTTGGEGPTDGRRAAVPVYVVSGGQAPLGQRARRVVVVTDGPVEGGAAIPVYDAGPIALYSSEASLPVYVVQGSLGAAAQTYTQKVQALGPIAYWPMAEPSGSVALDESGNGRTGAYTAVTLGAAGIGDGRTAASFNGATSFNNVYTPSLAAAFGAAEGTLAGWMQASGAGFWSDTVTTRRMAYFLADTNNRVYLQKTTTPNQLTAVYIAGGTNKSINFATGAPLAFFHFALTWSKAADQFKFYIAGAQVGSTATGLGTWAGALSSTNATIGCGGIGPFNVHDGSLAHVAVWNTPLSAAQVATLATP